VSSPPDHTFPAPSTATSASRRAAGEQASRSVEIAGRRVEYALRVSTKARRLRLVIRAGSGLEVVVPRGMPVRSHEAFVQEKAAWIIQTLDRLRDTKTVPETPSLSDGSRVRYAGRELTLRLRDGTRTGHYRAALREDSLHLSVPELEQAVIRRALEHWYRRQAEAVFTERLALHNRVYQFRYGRVSVKAQKTRWGSCSKQGNLNFNWRLLLAPIAVLDYVVVHELCHLREMNHGSKFWQLVALGCPEYAVHRRWLRAHGQDLVL
jgi:predicted metal-dependent hydrolase